MKWYEGRNAVIAYYEGAGMVVYEQRMRYGLPMLGQIVVLDPGDPRPQLVRIMVGKRPPRSKRLIIDRRRVGVCDVIAKVDPRDGWVTLEGVASGAEAQVAA